MEALIEVLGPAVSAALAAGVTAILGIIFAYVGKWIPIPPEAQVKVTELAKDAINRVEDTAKNAAADFKGPKKLQAALGYINDAADRAPEVKKYTQKQLTRLVESLLISDITPKETTPKDKASDSSTKVEL